MTFREAIKLFLRNVKELEKYDENDSDGYKKEFKKITILSRRALQEKLYPATFGEMQCNLSKNRYKDILPYDHSRVVLKEVEGKEGSDYINANFIKGVNGNMAYIASQGPQPNTVDDFWRMLWQYEIRVVIMACNEFEGAKLKCKCYWPEERPKEEFAGISVEKIEVHNFEEFTLRILQATFEDTSRLLYQLHYNSWPDHGTPSNLEQIFDMIALARQYQGDIDAPIVVHCSAGCGRTGTILVIDYAWNLLKLGKLDSAFSIFELIKKFRTQRQSIVQSEDQYVFVHMAVKELFERHLQILDDHYYENVTAIDGVCTQETSDDIYENIQQDMDDSKRKIMQENSAMQAKSSREKLPPPKPGRLGSNGSPAKATIEETLAKLSKPSLPRDLKMSSHDLDDLQSLNEDGKRSSSVLNEKPKIAIKPVAIKPSDTKDKAVPTSRNDKVASVATNIESCSSLSKEQNISMDRKTKQINTDKKEGATSEVESNNAIDKVKPPLTELSQCGKPLHTENTSTMRVLVNEMPGLPKVRIYDEIELVQQAPLPHLNDADESDDSTVFDSDNEANVPEVPKKNIYAFMLEEETSDVVTYKGINIGFGKRLMKPKGPREQVV